MALVGPSALDPRIVQRLSTSTPARGWVLDTLASASSDRSHASARLRAAARDARKLRSRERRALFDVVYDLIRHQSAHEALGASGWAEILSSWLQEADTTLLPFAQRAGCADWVADDLQQTYADEREAWLHASNARPPSILRVNTRQLTREQLSERLAQDGIVTEPIGEVGLMVQGRANLIGHPSFRSGHFELQDLASQKVSAYVQAGNRSVLDLCAGAGGKSLAMAAMGGQVFATDIRSRALDELRSRAKRARTKIQVVPRNNLRTYEKVLVDAPCSGSGVWRRHPEFRWRLEDEGPPTSLQLELLNEAAQHVASGGEVIYATCSALRAENEYVVAEFLGAHPEWIASRPPLRTAPHIEGTDGMFAAALKRA